jgi:hypothetical protein
MIPESASSLPPIEKPSNREVDMSNLDDLLENYEGGSGELDLEDLLNEMEPSAQ